MDEQESLAGGLRSLRARDLEEWAGRRTLERGRGYQLDGCVRECELTSAGQLAAWVDGRQTYRTVVWFDSRAGGLGPGGLCSACTCPVGGCCKHAVALILAARERLKSGLPLADVSAEDPRVRPLGTAERATRDDGGHSDEPLASFLRAREKAELVEFLHRLGARYPEAREELEFWRAQHSPGGAVLVQAVERALEAAFSEEPSDSHFGSWVSPDLGKVEAGFERLLAAGLYDELLPLGEDLLELGREQLEMIHDDGEFAIALEGCLDLVFEAVSASSLADEQKLLYAIGLARRDDLGLTTSAADVLDRSWSPGVWSAVADALEAELLEDPGAESDGTFERERLANWLTEALDRAGRASEADEYFAREARRHASFLPWVRRLQAAGRLDEARRAAEEGCRALAQEQPWAARELHRHLIEIAIQGRQWSLVAAYQAESFFLAPSLAGFRELLAAAKKVRRKGLSAQLREAALAFLESGVRPTGEASWPLDAVETMGPSEAEPSEIGGARRRYEVLRALAIEERRPDDVLRWHDELEGLRGPRPRGFDSGSIRVAEAIAATRPDRAIELFLIGTYSLIETGKVAAYGDAGQLLRRVRDMLLESERRADWETVLDDLREVHGRKWRLMEVVGRLEAGGRRFGARASNRRKR